MLKFLLFGFCVFSLASSRAQDKKSDTTDSRRILPERTISFSGYKWTVRNIAGKQGPGPNYFNDSSV
ncbi:MAG TPA: hypothetical protein VGM24_05650, partial [Puia sp.]